MRPDFQRLFEAAPGLYMVLAPDPPRFTVVAASDAYLRAVKKRRDELVGRAVFEALPVPPEDRTSEANSRASFERAIALRVADAMAVQRHDIIRPEAEGGGFETRYWSPVNTPVLGDDGEVLYVLHRVEDVTELVQAQQKDAEQQARTDDLRTRLGRMELDVYRRAQEIQHVNAQLRDANARLSELDRAKTVFFSNVSHELRTPLTLILGTIEELRAGAGVAAGAAARLDVAHRNALRLLKLVNSLLDFSRIEAGRSEATYYPTDLARLTALLASSFQSACESAGLRLTVDCPPLPQPVYVDRGMWEKVVLNLVSNALKFTLSGEIEVSLRAVGSACELSVRDTGVGIPEAELPRIFERFHRVEGAGGRSVEGTGIGLALVKELVALHGGSIEADSSPGRGSVFSVRVPFGTAHLPAERLGVEASLDATSGAADAYVEEAAGWMQQPAREPAPAPRLDAVEAASGPATTARARVIVADDNADMREYLRRLLAPQFEVEAVADGEEALAAARRLRPDLVLSDIMMPRLDGLGLVASLRADERLSTVPVILVSARAGEDARGEGIEAGADDYLMKPFSARELVARVTTHLKLARSREEIERAAAREEALRDADRRKNEFLAMLSHELRNPLAPIKNSLYVLERSAPGGEQARRAQQTIDRQVSHLARMLEDLLDVSRITQGRMQLQTERLELNNLVRGVIEDARATFERAGIALDGRSSREPLFVSGDPTRLAQVVGNLLANSAKFTASGGHVTVSVEAEQAMAVIRVRDDGSGIPADVLGRLFEPFVQADQTIDRSAGGLGLGLAVVKGVVELHGGTVAAHSEGVGKGAQVTVRLPLRQRAKRRGEVARPRAVSPLRVLVIEDNPDAARTLKEALELNGHLVDVAGDGASGVERSRELRPDAIVCDIGLPQMDGYAVARAVRAHPELERVCLVAVTGYAALDDVERSRAAGFDHHFSKPPDVAALERVLGDCKPRPAA